MLDRPPRLSIGGILCASQDQLVPLRWLEPEFGLEMEVGPEAVKLPKKTFVADAKRGHQPFEITRQNQKS